MAQVHTEGDLSQWPKEVTAQNIPGHPSNAKGTPNYHHTAKDAPEIPESTQILINSLEHLLTITHTHFITAA